MNLQKLAGALFVLVGVSGALAAAVPEIDPASAGNAIALVAGALLIYRSRRRR